MRSLHLLSLIYSDDSNRKYKTPIKTFEAAINHAGSLSKAEQSELHICGTTDKHWFITDYVRYWSVAYIWVFLRSYTHTNDRTKDKRKTDKYIVRGGTTTVHFVYKGQVSAV
jgi:hypothetical protein